MPGGNRSVTAVLVRSPKKRRIMGLFHEGLTVLGRVYIVMQGRYRGLINAGERLLDVRGFGDCAAGIRGDMGFHVRRGWLIR
jgi:hypothetical protein